MANIPYRPEIDGLRAVAVLAVLIYHAGFSFLPGGFMGVDIFFVISGFLITSFIVKDIHAGTFTLAGFWERRARRILPPLFVVLGATILTAAFLFLPFDFALVGQQVMSQSAFASNIWFMFQGGYFDSHDAAKALLHTWSLAVEEQYYLFFPIAMILFARYVGRDFLYLLVPVALFSFVICILMSGLSDRAAFYLLPFRGWELLVGAILAVLPVKEVKGKEIIATIGAVLIGVSLLLFKPTMVFPGYVTLLPVIGAALIIFSGSGSFVGKALSLRPVVAIGLISYSLYLWHWPVLVFVKYVPVIEFTPVIGAVCIAISMVLAGLTWKYVEQPVRRKDIFKTRKSIFAVSGIMLILFAGIGFTMVAFKGFPQRFGAAVVQLAAGKQDENPHRGECDQVSLRAIEADDVCQTNKGINPDFILWGDSYADAIAPAFYELSKEHNRNGYVVTAHGCPPIVDGHAGRSFTGFDCLQSNKAVFDLIVRKKIKDVYLVGNWDNWMRPGQVHFNDTEWYDFEKDQYNNIAMDGLERTIEMLQKNGVMVHIVMDVPLSPIDPPRQLALEKLYGLSPSKTLVPLSDYRERVNNSIGQFRELNGNEAVGYIDPSPLLCDADWCYAEKEGRSLYFNPGHLSTYGAISLKEIFVPYFKK